MPASKPHSGSYLAAEGETWVTMAHYEELLAERDRLFEQLETKRRALVLAETNLGYADERMNQLKEQLEATEQRLAREISEHADREQALRQLQFLAVNGQNRHSDSLEALREIESRAREALNPASTPDASKGDSDV